MIKWYVGEWYVIVGSQICERNSFRSCLIFCPRADFSLLFLGSVSTLSKIWDLSFSKASSWRSLELLAFLPPPTSPISGSFPTTWRKLKRERLQSCFFRVIMYINFWMTFWLIHIRKQLMSICIWKNNEINYLKLDSIIEERSILLGFFIGDKRRIGNF